MSPVSVNYWAEGPTDRAAACRLIRFVGGIPGADYSGRWRAAPDKDYLDRNLGRYNEAARFAPRLILRDADGECATQLVARLLRSPARNMRFRVVVPAIEAWLLADCEAISDFLGIAPEALPQAPEPLQDIKGVLVGMARRSRKRGIREDFVPHPRSGRKEGPGYAAGLVEFINGAWNPDRASARAPSLSRALRRLAELVER